MGAKQSRSIESKIGRGFDNLKGDTERPYGKCYGQVGGISYPCTQQAAEEERDYHDERKAAYQKAKRAHNCVKIRCVETGEVWPSMKDAQNALGIAGSTIRSKTIKQGYFELNGKRYVRCD